MLMATANEKLPLSHLADRSTYRVGTPSPEEPALVHVENHSTGLFLEEEVDLAAYRVALRTILQAALAPAATIELIIQIATELG